MRIMGVRNFDTRKGETIEFEAPLTLIVGYNGSGKTTIIECLKYATTGTLPPNSKNGAFVHDPKLDAEKESMAQIKLQFTNQSGHRMVVTRSLQVQLKKGSLPSMKTLECQLMTEINGERSSMSKRVAELDSIIPPSLGVPAAILESVIFCHQDESLWPMSEPSLLKKKFDSIFEAEKYTKAVDNLKAMRKSKLSQNALFKQGEDHARIVKDKAEKVSKQMSDLHEKIEEHREKAATLKQAMNVAKALGDDKRSQAHEVLGSVDKLRNHKERARYLRDSLDRLEANLVEITESDEWLTATLSQYTEKMAQYGEQSQQYTNQYLELQQNTKSLRQQIGLKQAEQGRHQAAKESYENALKSRIDLVKEAARSHSLRGYEGDIDEDHVQDFVDRIQKLFQEKDRELDRVKKAAEDERNKLRGDLNALSIKRSTHTQEKVNARQSISASERKIELQENEVNRIKMDEGTKTSRDVSLAESENRLAQLTSEFEAGNWDGWLRTEKKNLAELESEQQRLHEDFLQSTTLAESRAQLDVNKKQAKRLRSDLEIQKSTHDAQFKMSIADEWELATLEALYQDALDRKGREVAEAKTLQHNLSEELNEINLRLKTHRASLAKKTEDKDKSKAMILDSIVNPETGKPIQSVDDYPAEFEALKKEHDDFMKEFDGMNYISEYYTKAGEVVQKRNVCRLCERPFASQTERSSALDKINKLIKKYATETAEQERLHLSTSWKKAQEAKLQYDLYLVLVNSEIPSLERDIQKLESKRTPLLKRLEQQDLEVGKVEAVKRDAEAQRNNVNNLLTLANQIASIDEEIAQLSSPQSLSASTLSTEEIREQSEACKNRLMSLRAKFSKLEQERDTAQKNIDGARNEVGFQRDKATKAKYELDRKLEILSAISELREHISQQRDIDSRADVELEALLPQFKKIEALLEDATKRGLAKEKDVQTEKDRLNDTVNKFQHVNRRINEYIESGGPTKLSACERAIQNLESDLKNVEIEQAEITRRNNELQKMIDDSEKTKRSMEDNLACRQFRRELGAVQHTIDDLVSQNFQERYERLDEEADKATEEYQKLTGQRSVIIGAMSTMDDQFSNLQQEWDTEYKNAATVFREAHVKLVTNTATCEDLAKFTRALDEAIIKFHTLKMQEINSVAGELWRSTYQGTDVDTIMIKSESESTTNKRAINYRLVMIKQDAEMDMRGRCSAGQRVLACIIIRLALAECFGINCGVIALDEPTTNLDSDNIKALAISLNQLIKHRQHQKNFQLIIITHDEEFLKHMRCTDFTDNYYRIFRDVDQKSSIRRQKIGELAQ